MASKPLKAKASEQPENSDASTYADVVARYTQSNTFFQRKRDGWTDSEMLFNSVRADLTSDSGLITDGSLTTLIIERAARVSAQLQTGRVNEIGTTSSACANVVDLIWQHDIIPNANSGNPFQIKLFQTEMGSDIYGTYPVMYGLNVTDENAYADFWLVKPQLYYPQPGKTSPFDMQWAQVETTVTAGQLKAILANDNTKWNKEAINKLINELKEGSSLATTNDTAKTTFGQRENYDQTQVSGKGDYAPVTLRTEYQSGEKGKWITYAPDHADIILRNVPNPHKNGRIPIVHLTSIPQFDELYGISTMDRGKTIQKTIDSFTNLGYQNALLNVLPITKVKTGAVISSTLDMKPGATWRMDDLNAVQPYTTGNVAAEYFQTSISSMRSILLNQNGTTDTQLSGTDANSPQFGRTPQAMKQRDAKQNARDSLSVRMYDQFYSELASGLIDVKLHCATKPIQINLDKDRVAELMKDEDTAKLIKVDDNGTTITIATGPLKTGKYKYKVDPGSSIEADDATEHERLTEIITTVNSVPELVQRAEAEGYALSAGALLKRLVDSSGTSDADEIIHKLSDEELAAKQQQEAEAMAQAQAQGIDPATGQPIQDPNTQAGYEERMQQFPQDEIPGEQMPQEDIHPFVQHLTQSPDEAIQHIANGGGY